MTDAEIKSLKPGDRVRVHGYGRCKHGEEIEITLIHKRQHGDSALVREHWWVYVEDTRGWWTVLESDEYLAALGRPPIVDGKRTLGAEMLLQTTVAQASVYGGMFGGLPKP